MNTNRLLAEADFALAALAKAKLDGDLGKVAQARADVVRVQGLLQKAKADGETLTLMKGTMRSPMRLAG